MSDRAPATNPATAGADPGQGLAHAVQAARLVTEHAARVRHALLHEMGAVMRELEGAAAESRRMGAALSAGCTRVAATASLPPQRSLRAGEGALVDAGEHLAAAVAALARAAASVSTGSREQLVKREVLYRGLRRVPELNARLERTRAQLERSFRWSGAAAMAGRLTFNGRILAALVGSRQRLEALGERLESLREPLGRAGQELGFFACRGTAAPIAGRPGRRGAREVQLRPDDAGELMLVWNRYEPARLRIYPAHGAGWRERRVRWALCFALPRGDAGGRDLWIVRPALGVWTAPGTARLVRAGVLAWEQPSAANRHR